MCWKFQDDDALFIHWRKFFLLQFFHPFFFVLFFSFARLHFDSITIVIKYMTIKSQWNMVNVNLNKSWEIVLNVKSFTCQQFISSFHCLHNAHYAQCTQYDMGVVRFIDAPRNICWYQNSTQNAWCRKSVTAKTSQRAH